MAFLLTTASLGAMATPTEQCIANHFARAAENPDDNYETDRGVVKIWCQCTFKQLELDKTEYEALEFCFIHTNDAINKHLKMGPYSK